MESLESLAQLLNFGKDKPLQPPRFAKVVNLDANASNVITVQLGNIEAEAVRCCTCQVGDVVLLETLPNGTLAAVGTRGQTGGGGEPGPQGPKGDKGDTGAAAGFGTPTATATELPAGSAPTATVTASGPDTAKVFSFAFGIAAAAGGGGVEVITNNVTHAFTQTAYTYTCLKYDSGLLIALFSDYYTGGNGSAYSPLYYMAKTVQLPSAVDATAPAFVDVPWIVGQTRAASNLTSLQFTWIDKTFADFWLFAAQRAIPTTYVDFVAVGFWK